MNYGIQVKKVLELGYDFTEWNGEKQMKKEDLTVPAIFAEAIGMILGIVYIGLQIYYGIAYKVAPYKFICNIAGVVLIYVGCVFLR